MTAAAPRRSAAPRVEKRARLSWTPAQGHQHDHPTVPKPALYAAAAIMVGTLVFAYVASRYDAGSVRPGPIAATATRALDFTTLSDGAVRVNDAKTGGVLVVVAEKNSGFIRGVLRSLARDRRAAGLAAEPIAAVLERAANGRMTITDRATGRRIELAGFGRSNYEAFARLIATTSDVSAVRGAAK